MQLVHKGTTCPRYQFFSVTRNCRLDGYDAIKGELVKNKDYGNYKTINERPTLQFKNGNVSSGVAIGQIPFRLRLAYRNEELLWGMKQRENPEVLW